LPGTFKGLGDDTSDPTIDFVSEALQPQDEPLIDVFGVLLPRVLAADCVLDHRIERARNVREVLEPSSNHTSDHSLYSSSEPLNELIWPLPDASEWLSGELDETDANLLDEPDRISNEVGAAQNEEDLPRAMKDIVSYNILDQLLLGVVAFEQDHFIELQLEIRDRGQAGDERIQDVGHPIQSSRVREIEVEELLLKLEGQGGANGCDLDHSE